jgi:hypothetical protein
MLQTPALSRLARAVVLFLKGFRRDLDGTTRRHEWAEERFSL